MSQYKRKQLLVDPKVQGSLVLRVVAYWIACVVCLELLNVAWLLATEPEQPSYFAYFGSLDWRPVCVRLLASAVLLVPITFDMLRLSNRFAGPVFRMRRMLRQVADGGAIQRIKLRDNDFWHGFASDLNAALARLTQDNSSAGPSPLEQDSLAAPPEPVISS